MPQDPHAQIDETVLDMIERSPTGAVPHTPTYQDAVKRLHASQKVYGHSDYKDGHVTARSLADKPIFYASNFPALIAGAIDPEALESNNGIFTRYVASLPPALQPKAEALRLKVAGRPVQHRHSKTQIIHDPVHSLFLVPGGGVHPGIPGNYLYGSLVQDTADVGGAWSVHLHDGDDGASVFVAPSLKEAITMMQDVIASAPFHLHELVDLGFEEK